MFSSKKRVMTTYCAEHVENRTNTDIKFQIHWGLLHEMGYPTTTFKIIGTAMIYMCNKDFQWYYTVHIYLRHLEKILRAYCCSSCWVLTQWCQLTIHTLSINMSTNTSICKIINLYYECYICNADTNGKMVKNRFPKIFLDKSDLQQKRTTDQKLLYTWDMTRWIVLIHK